MSQQQSVMPEPPSPPKKPNVTSAGASICPNCGELATAGHVCKEKKSLTIIESVKSVSEFVESAIDRWIREHPRKKVSK